MGLNRPAEAGAGYSIAPAYIDRERLKNGVRSPGPIPSGAPGTEAALQEGTHGQLRMVKGVKSWASAPAEGPGRVLARQPNRATFRLLAPAIYSEAVDCAKSNRPALPTPWGNYGRPTTDTRRVSADGRFSDRTTNPGPLPRHNLWESCPRLHCAKCGTEPPPNPGGRFLEYEDGALVKIECTSARVNNVALREWRPPRWTVNGPDPKRRSSGYGRLRIHR